VERLGRASLQRALEGEVPEVLEDNHRRAGVVAKDAGDADAQALEVAMDVDEGQLLRGPSLAGLLAPRRSGRHHHHHMAVRPAPHAEVGTVARVTLQLESRGAVLRSTCGQGHLVAEGLLAVHWEQG